MRCQWGEADVKDGYAVDGWCRHEAYKFYWGLNLCAYHCGINARMEEETNAHLQRKKLREEEKANSLETL
jgi:hypothetical protein